MIKVDIKIGDTILTGKWKNKKVVVKNIGTDEYGSPTVNGKSILKIRIPKLYEGKKMKLKEIITEDKNLKTIEQLRKKIRAKITPELKKLIMQYDEAAGSGHWTEPKLRDVLVDNELWS